MRVQDVVKIAGPGEIVAIAYLKVPKILKVVKVQQNFADLIDSNSVSSGSGAPG